MTALAEILGDSPGLERLRGQIDHILKRAATARRPPAILLRGETGTGKGLVARTMHREGPRAHGPFVDVNCAAIPENLLEAELFGYERGAFTDARQAKPGLFQLAHHGMLFLDEIGTLSPALQAKLLKVLEDGVVRRLGGTRPEPVDVWIVAATNEDLTGAMRARRFREDLYHRLAVLSLELPPLRERGADISLLAGRFLARACADYGLPLKSFARDALAALGAYDWPGNVRELGNVIERVALLGDESVITAAMLGLPTPPHDDRPATEPSAEMTSNDRMRAHLLQGLTETGWNISQTAVRLGVARNTVVARMARFGLNRSTPSQSTKSLPRDERVAHATMPDAPVPPVASSGVAWEPRRVALLRVDAIDAGGALEAMIGKVEAFEGEIVELGRSAFVAAFGLEAIEDAPVRAALAALAILKAAERTKGGGGAGVRVKIAVHVAQVLVSQHQGSQTIDLDSKRPAWTTIEALVDLGQVDTIVVSDAAVAFLERRFELMPAAPSEASAIPFRRLTRREPTGFGLGGRPLSQFVGRDAELRLVTDRVAATARGHGQVIGIVGEPGVGKSRFVYELTRIGAMHDWRVLRCGGVSHGTTTPLLPIGDLLRRYFAIEDAEAGESIHAKVKEALLARHEALRPLVTPLLSLLDVTVDDEAWSNLDPLQRRRRVQDAVKELLRNESRIQPLVVIVEDLHWIDTATQALIDGLVESLPTARLLLVVSYRPEYQHHWGSKSYYTQLRLGALPPENTDELLHALMGDDPELAPLTRQLVKRGNPFFIEESIRTVVEAGALSGTRGAYRLTRPIDAIEIPATVQLILAERIERLAAADKQLLRTASVIGKDVPFVLLHAVTDDGEEDVQRGLAHLSAAEFLYETRFPPDLEYTFKHALTHEVTYGSLLEDRRKALHARIVGAIERAYPDRLTEHVERLAHHAVQGELWEKAFTYLREAGTKAAARSAHREAVAHFERALTVIPHLAESPASREAAIDLRFACRTSLLPLGELDRILELLLEAEVLAGGLADQLRLGWVTTYMTIHFSMTAQNEQALALGQRAVAIAESVEDVRLGVVARAYLGQAEYRAGDYHLAADRLRWSVTSLAGDLVRERLGQAALPAVYSRILLAASLAELGEFSEGTALAHEAIRIGETLDHPFSLGLAFHGTGRLYLGKGDVRTAIELLEHGRDLSRARGVEYWLPVFYATMGLAYATDGRSSEAFPLLEEAIERLSAPQNVIYQSLLLMSLSETYLLADRAADAARRADEALQVAHDRSERGIQAHALRLLGDISMRRDPLDLGQPEQRYREALVLSTELGMRPLVAHCHAGLGRLFERSGKREEARRHETIATTLYREMGMTYWLDRAAT